MTRTFLTRRATLGGLLALGGAAAGMACAMPAQPVVVIEKMKFGVAPEGLKVGDVIVWQNHDLFRHSVTARDGSFDLELDAGSEGTVSLRTAGAIEVYCRFHPGMKLKLTVNPA